jgi:hypothetical protein
MFPIHRRNTLLLGSALACLAANASCGGAPTPEPSTQPSTRSSAQATATASPAKPAEPPGEKLTELTFGKTKVVIEECPLDPALTSEKGDPLTSIARVKDHLFIADGTAEIRAYAIKPGCRLVLDQAIGDKGVVKAPREISVLSSDAKGNLLASSGVFDAYLIRDGKVVGPCGSHYAALHPSGAWALSSFANADVQKITVAGDTCKSEPWGFQSMGDDAKRKGPFLNVNSVGFAHDWTLVGGILAGPKETRVVIGLDATGSEKIRFGSDTPVDDDGFGWVHASAACGSGLCIADANFSAVSMWTREGKFLGRARLNEALKLPSVWVPTLAAQDANLLVGISLRPASGAQIGRVLRFVLQEGK